jgi:hypothetical protein
MSAKEEKTLKHITSGQKIAEIELFKAGDVVLSDYHEI